MAPLHSVILLASLSSARGFGTYVPQTENRTLSIHGIEALYAAEVVDASWEAQVTQYARDSAVYFELVSEPTVFISVSSIRNWYQIQPPPVGA